MRLPTSWCNPTFLTFLAPMCPERHLEAAEILGCEVQNPKKADAGLITADIVRKYMNDVRFIRVGLKSNFI